MKQESKERKEYKKQWSLKNKDRINTAKRGLKRTDKDKEYQKIYQKIYRNSDKCKESKRNNFKQTYQNNIQFKLAHNLRKRLRNALNRNQKMGSAIKDLGCSIDDLKFWLEFWFEEGMSWENYGKWHIDHIKPLSKIDLTNKEEFLKVNHYTNLQPLWAKDNLKKSNKF